MPTAPPSRIGTSSSEQPRRRLDGCRRAACRPPSRTCWAAASSTASAPVSAAMSGSARLAATARAGPGSRGRRHGRDQREPDHEHGGGGQQAERRCTHAGLLGTDDGRTGGARNHVSVCTDRRTVPRGGATGPVGPRRGVGDGRARRRRSGHAGQEGGALPSGGRTGGEPGRDAVDGERERQQLRRAPRRLDPRCPRAGSDRGADGAGSAATSSAAVRARERNACEPLPPRRRSRSPATAAAAISQPVAWSSACTGSGTGRSAPATRIPALGDAGRHLHERVEPAAAGPRPAPPVGGERDLDQARAGCPGARRRRARSRRARRGGSRARARPRRRAGRRAARAPPASARRCGSASLPSVMSGTTAGSSQSGGSTRSTVAPSAASALVATGPASTRVRSSTRTPASGRPGSGLPVRQRRDGVEAVDERLPAARRALRVREPRLLAPHRRGRAPGLDDRGLEVVRLPRRRRPRRPRPGPPASRARRSAAARCRGAFVWRRIQPSAAA